MYPIGPEPDGPPPARQNEHVQILQVDDCHGHSWLASPSRNIIFYWAKLEPPEAARAILEAHQALAEYRARPHLSLVPPPLEDAVLTRHTA